MPASWTDRTKLLWPLLLGLGLVQGRAWGSCLPTYVSSASASGSSSGTPDSFSFGGAASGANALLVLHVLISSGQVTGATFNGAAFSFVRRDTTVLGWSEETWALVAPSSGSFNVIVSTQFSASLMATVALYNGVNQCSPIGATAFGTGSSTSSSSMALSTTQPNSLVEGALAYSSSGSVVGLGAAQTQESDIAFGGVGLNDDDEPAPTTGSYSLQDNFSGSLNYAEQAIEIESACDCVLSPTPSPSVTPSPTPTPLMAVVKSASASSVTLGDTLTYCVSWQNDSSASAHIVFWDTLSPVISYQGCSNGCSHVGQVVTWDLGSQAPGSAGSACAWGVVSGYP
jgi:uncharacterized repeat protein (TIGR01451 family)